MSANPYDAPLADPSPVAHAAESEGGYTDGILQQLVGTRPWVRFISILGFVASALMVVGGLGMMALGAVGAGAAGGSKAASIGLGFAYLVFSVVYIAISLYLYRYAASIQRAQQGGGAPAIEEALGHQRMFWRAMGILSIVMLVIMALAFFGGIMGAVLAAGSRG